MDSCATAGLILLSCLLVLILGASAQSELAGKASGGFPAPAANVCGEGKLFCENVTNYPEEKISAILRVEGSKHNDIFGVESEVKTEQSEISTRIGAEEFSLCSARSQIIFPKVAENKNGTQKYIVNFDEEYVQGIRVEVCGQPGGKCSFSEVFPGGYTTKCVQKFVYRRLLAVGSDGVSVLDEFKLPSCCVCSVVNPSLK